MVILGEELIERWEWALASRAPAVAAALLPGHRSPEETAAEAGVTLSREASVWWGRHDGAGLWTPFGEMVALRDALDDGRSRRRAAVRRVQGLERELRNDPAWALESLWSESWVPIFFSGGSQITVLECAVAPDSPSPVICVDSHGVPERPVLAPSLGEFLLSGIEALEGDRVVYDPGGDVWLSR